MDRQELEVKFFVRDLVRLEAKLLQLGARQIQARQHEQNLRFDTPQVSLKDRWQVLRLRQDQSATLTYKGPTRDDQGASRRTEIEFTVGDFDAAQALLEALGYGVSFIYEKYRATYALDGLHITLDELPFGSFSELEGSTPQQIRQTAARLGLDWERRVPLGYISLFDALQQRLQLPFRDLTFQNFLTLNISPQQLGVEAADLG